ncbi:unnamed protein product [Nezara viridula]|uniref:Phosphotyrosine protein phosphatase I domain-containing protein n=1 Tax=Nezara viridula TaxID=85310 RepID=A0A9P0MP08_NEZVI|nr:unnamed protein product [Nezara viridula]
MSDLKRLAPPNSKAKLQLLGSYDPSGELIIKDPYCTKGEQAFHKTLEQCTSACEGFLNAMAANFDRSVLFICLGNICRSPVAEAVFRKLLKEKGIFDKWLVDSAAIGSWHIGSKPDSRAISVLERNNIEINHRARQIEESDFHKFEFILGMDEENMSDLKRLAPPNSKAKLHLLGSFDPSGELIIKDPYYTKGEKAFHKTLEHCTSACEGFLNAVINK